jgi:Protein of unknown function (DUF3261)
MANGYLTLATRTGVRYSPLLLPLAILAGCTGDTMVPVVGYLAEPVATPVVESQFALFAPGRVLVLPHPADLGRTVEAVQMLSARYDSQTFVFEGRLSITPERFVLVGLDGMGRRAMTVTWDGRSLNIESAPWLPATVRPGSMLADIVVLYWPEAAVRKALAPAGCKLLVTAKSRKVRCDNDTVLIAKYDWPAGAKWDGALQYSNLAWGYEIEAQSKEMTPK